ncbi:MAG: HAD-IIA family hydrolase [Anaerolineaceae bacterium]|jgi:4-nitrophenyl phosphatase|nr:HAD-IIA family hydrolase [Anaerolineaceae bacterium]
MIQSTFPNVKALIIDMDGVLWKAEQPIGDLPAIFKRIQHMELKTIFATNNSTRTVEKYVERLNQFGIQADPEEIVTSSIATIHLLKKRYPDGGPVFVVGETGLVETLKSHGFYQQDENVLAVVAGMDTTATYAKLSQAVLLIHDGAAFYATNPDSTFPTPRGPAMGAGGLIAAIETSSGIKPIIAGKPFTPMMNLILEKLNLTPEEILAVGDRLNTDIQAGKNIGCKTALVLTGISTRAEAEALASPPDIITADFATLIG